MFRRHPNQSNLAGGPSVNPYNATPHRKKTSRFSRHQFLFIGIILFLIILLLSSIHNNKRKKQHQSDSFLRPSAGSHTSLFQLKVCSHQILNAPSNLPDGSLQAMGALWEAGINCFDIDIVTLKDGTLLTAHPRRFAAAVETTMKQPEEYTLEEAREAGVDEVRFPLLEQVLIHFASLVKGDNNVEVGGGLVFRYGLPLLNLDLKGPNLTIDHVKKLHGIITEQGILQNVAVCASALGMNEVGPGVDLLNILGSKEDNANSLSIGLVLRDLVVEDNDLQRVSQLVAQYPAVELIVPSNKFDKQYFHSLKKHLHKPITAWTVDDEEGLVHAIESGLDAIISNHPIEMSVKLKAIRRDSYPDKRLMQY